MYNIALSHCYIPLRYCTQYIVSRIPVQLETSINCIIFYCCANLLIYLFVKISFDYLTRIMYDFIIVANKKRQIGISCFYICVCGKLIS